MRFDLHDRRAPHPYGALAVLARPRRFSRPGFSGRARAARCCAHFGLAAERDPKLVFRPFQRSLLLLLRFFPPRLMKKVSIDIADLNGSAFRRLLCSAERFSERAIALGSPFVNTPDSKSSASLRSITFADHFLCAIPRWYPTGAVMVSLSNHRRACRGETASRP